MIKMTLINVYVQLILPATCSKAKYTFILVLIVTITGLTLKISYTFFCFSVQYSLKYYVSNGGWGSQPNAYFGLQGC